MEDELGGVELGTGPSKAVRLGELECVPFPSLMVNMQHLRISKALDAFAVANKEAKVPSKPDKVPPKTPSRVGCMV